MLRYREASHLHDMLQLWCVIDHLLVYVEVPGFIVVAHMYDFSGYARCINMQVASIERKLPVTIFDAATAYQQEREQRESFQIAGLNIAAKDMAAAY